MLTAIARLDELLNSHADVIGRDFMGYRNHTYRVANLCLALSRPHPDRLEKVAIAAAFHDLGIWTAGTFDYLQPSIRLARDYLVSAAKADWSAEISAMILEHHKILPCGQDSESLVEPFRRADWVDVSMGFSVSGLSRRFVRELFSIWPSAGFHRRLIQLTLHRWQSHPLSPLPMIRL